MPGLPLLVSFVAVALVLGVSQSAVAGDDDFSAGVYKSADGLSLNYRLLLPKNYDPSRQYPFVLFFHGAGERGDDNRTQLRVAVGVFAQPANREKFPCFVVAPQCPAGKQWVNVPWGDDSEVQPAEPSESMRLAMELFDQLQNKYNVDPKRLYVTGLSMGGFGTWDAITRWPDRFAAAIPVCGGGDEKQAYKVAKLPLWAFHGAVDTVVKTHRSRDMIAAIKQAGGNPKYTEYPGVGHDLWQRVYGEPELLPWLFSQSRK